METTTIKPTNPRHCTRCGRFMHPLHEACVICFGWPTAEKR